MKYTVVSVYNVVNETNTPLECFVYTKTDRFNLCVIVLYQNTEEAKQVLRRLYPDVDLTVFGVSGHGGVLRTQNVLYLIQVLRRLRPDIIHVHHTLSSVLAIAFGRFFTRAKLLTTVHSDFRFYKHYQKTLFFLTYLLSDCIVFNSKNSQKQVIQVGGFLLRNKARFVCYNGINITSINTAISSIRKGRKRVSSESSFIGAIGRLVEVKDFATLIRAFAIVRSSIPEARLALVGDGPLRRELQRLTMELEISDSVVFTGNLPRKEVYKTLGMIDVFVVCSKWEGFCNSMVEAMVAGKAIVASKIEALQEVLGSDCGLFFPPGDINALCENLIRVLNDPGLRYALGERARSRALREYSLDNCVQNYEWIYETLCARRATQN